MKTIKHLKQNLESNNEQVYKKTYKQFHDEKIVVEAKINTLKDVLGLIDERIKDLEGMLEIDEIWATSTITYEEAVVIISELKELKKRITK